MKILLICVDYNSTSETTNFINCLQDMPGKPEIILVCNSGSQQFDSLKIKHNVHVFDFERNAGYMHGAYLGYQAYVESNDVPDWVILSNTDIDFPDKNFWLKLRADKRNDFIIAPDIVSADGVHQNPFAKTRIPASKIRFLTRVYSNVVSFKLYEILSHFKSFFSKKSTIGDSQPQNIRIYAPHGSFIIIGGEYFKRGGSLEHPNFLYGEELFIAERARKRDIGILYDTSYKILHAEHVATGKMGSTFKARCLKDSLSTILKEFY